MTCVKMKRGVTYQVGCLFWGGSAEEGMKGEVPAEQEEDIGRRI